MLKKDIICGREVEYDDTEFEVSVYEDKKYLHYIGDGKNIRNPKNNISTFGMFEGCDLSFLDLSSFDTSKVSNMRFMFYNCDRLTSLNLGTFDTSEVTDMNNMFYCCIKLSSLDLSSFDISKVTDMESIFDGLRSITTIFVSKKSHSKWVSKFPDMKGYFVIKGNNTPDIELRVRKLLSEGKSEKEICTELKGKGISVRDVVSAFSNLNVGSDIVVAFCNKVIVPEILSTFKKNNGISNYNVGEVVDVLCKKYPENLVNKAIISVLREQYLVD